MQPAAGGSTEPQHAITDLYDAQRNTILVQYSPPFIVGMALAGVFAFAITGFLGYTSGYSITPIAGTALAIKAKTYPNFFESIFSEPWVLFFWLCALMMTLQWSIFRDPSLRRQRIQTLSATAISIVLAIILYKYRTQIPDLLSSLGDLLKNIGIVIQGSDLLLSLLNYGIIVIFWADSIRRWIRRYRGLPIAPQVDLRFNRPTKRNREQLMPSLQELISGDLIAGGVLTFLLSLIFLPQTLQAIASAITSNPNASAATCSVGLGAKSCASADLNQSLILFAIGLLLLALTAMVNGLGALNALNREVVVPATETTPDMTGTDKGGKGVLQTLVETLLSAISRQFLNVFTNLGLALRASAWPFLIFAAVAGLGFASEYIQYFLHSTSCMHHAEFACRVLPGDPLNQAFTTGIYSPGNALGQAFYGSIVVIGGLIAALGVTFSASLLVYQWRVAENTLQFMRLVGFIVVLTYWLFSLALSAFNGILFLVAGTTRWPFYQPGLLTGLSAAALLVYGAIFFLNRQRRGDRGPVFIPQVGQRTFRKQLEAQKTQITTPTAPTASQSDQATV